MSGEPTISSSSTTISSSTRADLLGGGESAGVSSGSMGDSRGSVPTDLTVTSDADTADFSRARPRRTHSEAPNDRAGLLRTVELLRLQLATRDEQLSGNDLLHRVALARLAEERDVQLADSAAHADRLEQEAASSRRELAQVQERVARELATLTNKCATLQANMTRLSVTQDEARASLRQLEVGRAQYDRLKAQPEHRLNLREYAMLQLHEAVWPLRVKVSEVEGEKQQLEKQLNIITGELRDTKRQGAVMTTQTSDLREQVEGLKGQVDRLTDQLREEDFRVQSYSRVKEDRDTFEEELMAARATLHETTTELQAAKNESAALSVRLETAKSQARRAENDSAQAKEELGELRKKFVRATSDGEKGNTLLAAERSKLADTHHKYLKAQSELTCLRESLTDAETERNFLRGKVEDVSGNRGQLQVRVDELTDKCQSLQTELEKYKEKGNRCTNEYEMELSELRSSLLASTTEQTQLSNDNVELRRKLDEIQLDQRHDKLRRIKQINTLKNALREERETVSSYKKLEQEYIKTFAVLQSISPDQAKDTHRMVFPHPMTSGNQSFHQAMHLSSNILRLEREKHYANDAVEHLTTCLAQLKTSLYSYKSAISNIGEPAQSLHKKIIKQEEQIASLNMALAACQQQNSSLENKGRNLISLIRKLELVMEESLDETESLQRITADLNSVKDIVLKSLKLDRKTGRGTTASSKTLPSGITVTKDVRS